MGSSETNTGVLTAHDIDRHDGSELQTTHSSWDWGGEAQGMTMTLVARATRSVSV